ncbi:hypothetical protein [Kitasatospora sp. GAS1066B]|uniref:hypothetical protein n=1 Tax=Kitasatospora sp. GAS1066B TaxID=3156271 RepID=UPI0035116DD7
MGKAYIRDLPDGTRRGNARGLLRCQQDGWQILTGPSHELRYDPRTPRDCRPWTDGVIRYRALDCWAQRPAE